MEQGQIAVILGSSGGVLLIFFIQMLAYKYRFKKIEKLMVDNTKVLLAELDKLKGQVEKNGTRTKGISKEISKSGPNQDSIEYEFADF